MNSGLPEGYAARPATLADVDAVVGLRNEHDVSVAGTSEPYREYYRWAWGLPYVDLARDSVLVSDLHGTLVGLAHVTWDPAARGPMQATGRVHPSHLGRGLGTALLAWTERSSLGRAQDGPDRLFTSALAGDIAARGLFERHGFDHVRNFWDMERELLEVEPEGDPPEGVRIRPFRPGADERTLHEVKRAAFADHFGEGESSFESFAAEWFGAEDFDPTLVWVAETERSVVGFILAIPMETMGYIASLGVLKAQRGRGIGTSLLRHAFAGLGARGFPLVGLTVDAGNETGAVGLYSRLGMRVRAETHIYGKA